MRFVFEQISLTTRELRSKPSIIRPTNLSKLYIALARKLKCSNVDIVINGTSIEDVFLVYVKSSLAARLKETKDQE